MSEHQRKQEIARIFAELEARGELTPAAVVARAADPDSPLHPEFEWDTDSAAQAYREMQARRLIRAVRIEVTVNRVELAIPQYVHDPNRGQEPGYVALSKVRSSEEMKGDVMRADIVRARRALVRALGIATALGMEGAQDDLTRALGALDDLPAEVAVAV